eukprot:scaffold180_cov311-Pinguiococcus_pyrenoidosus.AAC.59
MRHPTTTSRVPRNSNHCSGTLNFFTVLAGAPISSTNRLAAGTSFFACTTIAASWCFTASFSSARKNESSGRPRLRSRTFFVAPAVHRERHLQRPPILQRVLGLVQPVTQRMAESRSVIDCKGGTPKGDALLHAGQFTGLCMPRRGVGEQTQLLMRGPRGNHQIQGVPSPWTRLAP